MDTGTQITLICAPNAGLRSVAIGAQSGGTARLAVTIIDHAP